MSTHRTGRQWAFDGTTWRDSWNGNGRIEDEVVNYKDFTAAELVLEACGCISDKVAATGARKSAAPKDATAERKPRSAKRTK